MSDGGGRECGVVLVLQTRPLAGINPISVGPDHSMTMQAFRTGEGVDIGAVNGGFGVGWTRAGEYLRYTVDVERDSENQEQTVLRGEWL